MSMPSPFPATGGVALYRSSGPGSTMLSPTGRTSGLYISAVHFTAGCHGTGKYFVAAALAALIVAVTPVVSSTSVTVIGLSSFNLGHMYRSPPVVKRVAHVVASPTAHLRAG